MQEPQPDHVVARGGVPDAGAGFARSVQVVFRHNPRAPVGAFVEAPRRALRLHSLQDDRPDRPGAHHGHSIDASDNASAAQNGE
ncbi:hypothetical protein ACVK00_004748 [Burkholderia sp. PvR073]